MHTALSRVDDADAYPSYLHAQGTLNPQAYVRQSADVTGESRIENPHTITFEVVVPFEYKHRNDLKIEKEKKRQFELQQLNHERELKQIEINLSKLGDPSVSKKVVRSITGQESKDDYIARVGGRRRNISRWLANLDVQKEDVQKEIHRLSKLSRTDSTNNKRAQNVARGRTLYYGQTIQLRHLYIGQFVTVNQAKISELDKSHLHVNIEGYGSRESMFKVLPRFKVRAEGDAVRAGDAIVLKSMSANGQHLACTPDTFQPAQRVGHDQLHQVGDHEVSLSAVPQAWGIDIMSKATPSSSSAVFGFSGRGVAGDTRGGGKGGGTKANGDASVYARGGGGASRGRGATGGGDARGDDFGESLHIGDVVYFHHRELEQYFSVNKTTGKAYSRKQRGVDSLWQICRQPRGGHLRGGQVPWKMQAEDAICLRHLQTGEYLCCYKPRAEETDRSMWSKVKRTLLRNDISTTTLRTSPFTRFSLSPIGGTAGRVVPNGAFIRIRNDERSQFVHLWQQHLGMTDHLAVHLSPEESFEDVFQVKKVELEYLIDVYRIQGACEVPQQLLIAFENAKGGSLLETDDERSLKHMLAFEAENASRIVQVATQCFEMLQTYLTPRTLDDVNRQNSRRMIVWSTQSGVRAASAAETAAKGAEAATAAATTSKRYAKEAQGTSMVRLAIMIVHRTVSCKSAFTLQKFGHMLSKDGGGPMSRLYESVFGFLDAACKNPDLSTLHPEKYIKRILQSYYRTIAAHLLFLNSKFAGKLLVAVTNDEQDLHNAARLGNNGDFAWLLEFLSVDGAESIGKRVPADYYRALAGLCINGKYASSTSQKLIGRGLVKNANSRRPLDESVLDRYDLVESKWKRIPQYRRCARRIEHGAGGNVPDIVDPLTRTAVKVIEAFMLKFMKKKKVKATAHLAGPPVATSVKAAANNTTTKEEDGPIVYNDNITRRVAQIRSSDETGNLVAIFDVGKGKKEIIAISELCRNVNKERNRGSSLEYKEPSLALEDEYFLLEAQLSMMAALCKSRSAAKGAVDKFYRTDLLFELMVGSDTCHGLRIEAAQLLFELKIDSAFGDNQMSPWNGPNLMRMWPDEQNETQADLASDQFNPFLTKFHNWVTGFEMHGEPTFVEDITGFCLEMLRISRSETEGWNGVNSSGREPFHQMHGEFVCTVLNSVNFMVLAGFYSSKENAHHAQNLLNFVLFPAIGSLQSIFDNEIGTDPGTLARTQMIARVLEMVLEITMELITKYQENHTVSDFIEDYRELYATLFEKKVAGNQSIVHRHFGVSRKSANAKIQHRTPALTDPSYDAELNAKFKEQSLYKQYENVRKYLNFVFAKNFPELRKLKGTTAAPLFPGHPDEGEGGTNFKELLFGFGQTAPTEVATAAMNLLVQIFQQEKFFFSTCEKTFIIASPNTRAVYRTVLNRAEMLRMIIYGNLMNHDIAITVTKSLNDLLGLVSQVTNADDDTVESSLQRLCHTEGLGQMMINMVCLQLDFKSAAIAELKNKQRGDKIPITSIETMLITALQFLEQLSKGSPNVQELIYSNVERLMFSPNTLEPIVSAHVAQALIPTFTNPFFQARAKKCIPTLCNAMLKLYEKEEFVAEYLDLLKAMATPLDPHAETTMVEQNQAYIMAYLTTHGTMSKDLLQNGDVVTTDLLDKSLNTIAPASKGSKESIKEQRQFIISLIELLATCGQGSNVYIESISREWLASSAVEQALNDVIETAVGGTGLLESNVQMPRFKAFITFYYHIYISEKSTSTLQEKPLISSPIIWNIIMQCKTEIINVLQLISGKKSRLGLEAHHRSMWRKQKDLVLNVCIPFLTQILTQHFTKRNLAIMKEFEAVAAAPPGGGGASDDDGDVDHLFSSDSSEADAQSGTILLGDVKTKFDLLSKELMEEMIAVCIPTEKDDWNRRYKHAYGTKVFDLFQALATVMDGEFHDAFGQDEGGSAWSLEARVKQKEYKLTAHRDVISEGRQKVYGTYAEAVNAEISLMLKENPNFDPHLVCQQVPGGFALKPGDDGLLTSDEHVNNHFQEFMQRLQDLDGKQVENEHKCHLPSNEAGHSGCRQPECVYLKPRSEGGLPCSSQHFVLVNCIRDELDKQAKTAVTSAGGMEEKNVVFKHIENLTLSLTDKSLSDHKRLFFESILNTMLQVVAAMLAKYRCEDAGSGLPINAPARLAVRKARGDRQKALSLMGGLSVTIGLFTQGTELIMKTAFQVFISLQESSPIEVQDAVNLAVRADSSVLSFTRIQEELHRTLTVVSDNIQRAESKAKAQNDERALQRGGGGQNRRPSAFSQFTDVDAGDGGLSGRVNTFVANHFGTYFDKLLEKEDGGDTKEVSLLAKDSGNDDGLNSGDALWCMDICTGLGKMVEGGHTNLKLALRSTQQGTNFVTELCAALEFLPNNVNESQPARTSWLELMQIIFYSLSELCEGVPLNRQDAYDANVIKMIARVLELSVQKERYGVAKAQFQAVSVLHVMIENHDLATRDFAAAIVDQLPPHILRRTVNILYLLYKFEDVGVQRQIFINCAFRCYFILRKLSDLTNFDLEEATTPVWTQESQHHQYHAIASRHADDDSDDVGDGYGGDYSDDDDDADAAASAARVEKRKKQRAKKMTKNLARFLVKAETKVESNVSFAKRAVEATDKLIYGKNGELQRLKKDEERSRANAKLSSLATPKTADHVELDDLSAAGKSMLQAQEMSSAENDSAFEIFFSRFLDWRNHTWDVPDRVTFFRNQTASIEFLRDKELQKVYYRLPENITVRLSQTFRDKILDRLSCENAQEKVRDFLEMFPVIRKHLQRQQQLNEYRLLRLITDGSAPYWRRIILTLTYILCLMMLVAFEVDPNSTVEVQDSQSYFPLAADNKWFQIMLSICGGLHILVSVGVCGEYFVNNSASLGSLSVSAVFYYLLFIACSVAGVMKHGYFYSYHLLHVIQNNDTLDRAVSAVTHNGWVLCNILFLIMKIIFIFSIFAFLWLRADFNDMDGMHCNSLRDCFATQLSNSLILGGGPREFLPLDTFVSENTTTFTGHLSGRLFNDLMFWIIVNVVTMSLVLGVIVDSFGQLRQQKTTTARQSASSAAWIRTDS